MTASPSRRRLTAIVAASLWLVLAFLVWNVCFDYGVRMAAVPLPRGAHRRTCAGRGRGGDGRHHVAGHRPIGLVGHHRLCAVCRCRSCLRAGGLAATYVGPSFSSAVCGWMARRLLESRRLSPTCAGPGRGRLLRVLDAARAADSGIISAAPRTRRQSESVLVRSFRRTFFQVSRAVRVRTPRAEAACASVRPSRISTAIRASAAVKENNDTRIRAAPFSRWLSGNSRAA